MHHLEITLRKFFILIAIVVATFVLWNLWRQSGNSENERLSYSQFVELIIDGRIKSPPLRTVTLAGNRAEGIYLNTDAQSERRFEVITPKGSQEHLARALIEQGVIVTVEDDEQVSWGYMILTTGFPLILVGGILIFFLWQMRAGGSTGGMLSVGKSRARLWSNQPKKVTFQDVAGVDEAKEELQEIVEFLREPRKFQKLGGRIPKGVLLVGPPGTGKTLLARATAGEASAPFFSMSGSEFVEVFVGVGASRVRDLFQQGNRHAPCLIFIDELDALGRQRGAGLGGGHDEREQALNQLLVEMDGFESNEGVFPFSTNGTGWDIWIRDTLRD